MSPAKTGPAPENAEVGFEYVEYVEHQVPSRRMPLPEADPEEAVTDESGRESRLPAMRERSEEPAATARRERFSYQRSSYQQFPADRLTFEATLPQTGCYRLKATLNAYWSTRRS